EGGEEAAAEEARARGGDGRVHDVQQGALSAAVGGAHDLQVGLGDLVDAQGGDGVVRGDAADGDAGAGGAAAREAEGAGGGGDGGEGVLVARAGGEGLGRG